MSDVSAIKHILKFKRGEVYSVDVFIRYNDDFVFQNMSCPKDTPVQIIEQFLYDAEVAALQYVIDSDKEDKSDAANT